jgi:glucose/arabinose dehydrogenase
MNTPSARRVLIIVAALGAGLAACGPAPSAGAQSPQGSGRPGPVETRPPNGSGQSPASAGQTRAPGASSNVAHQIRVVARGLDHPWALAFLPDGDMLVTERAGHMRRVTRDGRTSAPLAGVPAVTASGQGGLFDLALDPHFADNHLVYFTYFEPRGSGSGLTAARATLGEGGLSGLKVLFRATPADPDNKNIGGRLAFLPDGTLVITVGDRFHLMADAQSLDNDLGKLVRINPDGSIPKDNPFVGKAGARPEIYSYGHRNPEALTVDPATGVLWEIEHGPRGGDELNAPKPGLNYGWPVITYGIDYSGEIVGAGITQKAGMEQPVYYWDPVIAPSDMTFYDGVLFPAWKGSLFVGSLGQQHVDRLVLKDGKVVGEERLFSEIDQRIRDVRQGPDGALYVLTDAKDGQLIRIAPKGR